MCDYFIIGQGLAGSILGYLLHQAGAKIRIIDPGKKNASLVAGALINPITGKRLTKTWMADTLIPHAFNFYRQLEIAFASSFFKEYEVLRIFSSIAQANDWDSKVLNPAFSPYVSEKQSATDLSFLHTSFGFTRLKHGAYVDTQALLDGFKKYFLRNKVLDKSAFKVNSSSPEPPFFHGSAKAQNIIFCEGWRAVENPFFKNLPFLPSKGDVFSLKIENYPFSEIISKGAFLIPLNNGSIKSGSTYRWKNLNEDADELGYSQLKQKLSSIIARPFRIIDHQAAIRPTVQDRRPMLGRHHQYKHLFIFNGLGTKGYLLAPFFARQMVDFLLQDKPVLSAVSVDRFL